MFGGGGGASFGDRSSGGRGGRRVFWGKSPQGRRGTAGGVLHSTVVHRRSCMAFRKGVFFQCSVFFHEWSVALGVAVIGCGLRPRSGGTCSGDMVRGVPQGAACSTHPMQ